jgi:hypothetical protein
VHKHINGGNEMKTDCAAILRRLLLKIQNIHLSAVVNRAGKTASNVHTTATYLFGLLSRPQRNLNR